jgi:hypothetical protein
MAELKINKDTKRWAFDLLVSTDPQIKELRDALITEMAYNMYLEHNLKPGTIPFNKLKTEERREYFQRVEELIYND